jgi:hypothetical protein
MKYIKTYEGGRKRLGPKKGEYVILRFKDEEDDIINEFFANNIGKITFIGISMGHDYYYIKFNKIPKYISDSYGLPIYCYDENIIFRAKTKRELEYYLSAYKYNL